MDNEKLVEQKFKVCSKCGENLSVDMFYSSKTSKDGLKGICKNCDKLLAKQRYYKNKEDPERYEQMKTRDKERKRRLYQNAEYKERQNKRYAENTEYRERQKELARERYRRNVENGKTKDTSYNSQKYLSNRDAIRKQQKKYYEENREKIAEKHKEYYDNNKELALARAKAWRQTERGRASVKAGRHNYRLRKENAIGSFSTSELEEMLMFFDYKCAYTGESLENEYHLDHVIPLSKNGLNYIWNIVPSCEMANLSKKDKDMEPWFRKQKYFSEERLQKIYEWISLKQKEIKDLEEENDDDNTRGNDSETI